MILAVHSWMLENKTKIFPSPFVLGGISAPETGRGMVTACESA